MALHGFEPEDGRLSPETTTGGACPGSGCWLLTGRNPICTALGPGGKEAELQGWQLSSPSSAEQGEELQAPSLFLLLFCIFREPRLCHSPETTAMLQRSNPLWGWRPSLQGKSQQEGSHTQPCPIPGGACPLQHTGAGIPSGTAPAPAFRCDAATSASSASCDRGRLQTAALPREVGQLL